MKNKQLRVAAVFVVIVCVAFSFMACGKTEKTQLPQPTEEFFVNDFAGVLQEDDANSILKKGAALQESTTAQAIVVTVDSLDNKPIEDYALEIGREWGVGAEDEDNGIVILFSEGDREVYIAVGYGLEGALPDSKTGRILDHYGMSYFSADDFSTGLASVYNAIVNEVYIEYGIAPNENYIPADLLPDSQSNTVSAGKVAISWLVLMLLILIYTGVFGRRGGLFILGSPRFFSGGFHGGFNGSSGGFGGFKGGGGSFGGGGAGRKF